MENPNNVSVVIPTLSEDPLTLDSVPDWAEVAVVREGNRSEARNFGVKQTSGDIIVFCDDDITFSESFFKEEIESLRRGEITGLRDFDFGLLLTRFMCIYREDFEYLEGFDAELNHMEDTEFCLRAKSQGMLLRPLSHERIFHEEHESVAQGRKEILEGLYVILRRYPVAGIHLVSQLMR